MAFLGLRFRRLVVFAWFAATAPLLSAGEVRMKSGMVLTGTPRKLQSLTVKFDTQPLSLAAENVVLIMTGSAWYFVPSKQIPKDGLSLEGGLLKQEIFRISQKKQNPSSLNLASIGLFAETTGFDQFGHRRVTLNTAKKPIHVIQGITEITPECITLTGLNYDWEYGVSTHSISVDELELVLRHRIDPENSQLRLQLARFFIQAEMYPQAFRELEAIARDFPDLKDRATSVQQELVQEFGREVLRELRLRLEAGQYQLAENYARQIAPDQIGGAVQKDAAELLKAGRQRQEAALRVRDLLDEFPAKLDNDEQREKLLSMRSVLMEELHPDTLGRLDPFLKAADDDGYNTEEKLALAYSGWVLGAANAITELNQAIRLWDARFLVQEALRGAEPNARKLIYDEIRRVEGVGPETIRRMIPQLPPVIESPAAIIGQPFRVDLPETDLSPDVSYAVLLPPEYSPHHSYPLVITLRAQGRTPEQMLSWWGGKADEPGLSQRRGYIVISPEFAPANQGTYNYDTATHQRVLLAMNDARRRFNIDSERVFLSGHGMGADAAFDIGMSHPDEFAGVIPICGVCDYYAFRYIENATGDRAFGPGWYIVNGERDRNLTVQNHKALDRMMKNNGIRFDVIYCEYPQRGFEHYAEELPRIFEWMALHRRMPMPDHVDVSTLRKSDSRFFWLEAPELPYSVVLNAPDGAKEHKKAMSLDVKIVSGANNGNQVSILNSLSKRHTIWVHPDLFDLEKRVIVKIRGAQKYNHFVQPDLAATLEDYVTRGDRQRLFIARLDF